MCSSNLFPKLNVTDVLIDMDDTITYSKNPEEVRGGAFLFILAELVAEKEGISNEEALCRIRKIGDPESSCLFSLLPSLGIPIETYWKRVQEYLAKHLGLYEDAAILIKALHEKGIRLFPATTNSRMAILSKLAVFGLATMEGSPYFTEVFGGSEVCPGGKESSPDFFLSILKKFRLDPKKTLMIGDNPKADLALARAAGIEQVVLPRRDQKEAVVKEADGGLYVNSLELVLKML